MFPQLQNLWRAHFVAALSCSGLRELALSLSSKPIVMSDRFPAYEWIELKSRQICWAHLRRDMQAMIDRDGGGAEVGRRLLWQSDKLFDAWHKVRDGTIQRSTFLQTVAWLRPMVRSSLERGAVCACPKTATTCGELLRLWDCLWTFTRVEGVEPTNDAAEPALRHAVIHEIVPRVVEMWGGSSRTFSHHSVLASSPLLPDKGFWRL